MTDKIKILDKNDLDISYFCGSGPGGQARNKVASGVQLIHKKSGAIGRASDSRSQLDNRAAAFQRLTEHPKFKVWLNKKLFEIKNQISVEEAVEKELSAENLKYEIKENGKWKEVGAEYFEGEDAKRE